MNSMGRAVIVSLLVHGLVVALVYALPSDKERGARTFSADFTLVEYADLRVAAGAGTAPLWTGSSSDRRLVKKSVEEPSAGAGVRAAEQRAPVPVDQGLPQAVSLTPIAGEGQPGSQSSSIDGAPVAGQARPESAQGAGGAGSGRATILGSLDPGWADASGRGSGDGGSPQALRRIRDEIMKNVVYPERARRMGWEGRVLLSFMVHEDGSVHDERVLQSSGISMLDDAAKEALRKSVVKTTVGKRVHVVLPIEYRLR